MSESVKDQFSADFQKVKSVGGERFDRIRKIFQEALNQTASELKEGSTEVQTIAKDSNLIDLLKRPAASQSTNAAPEVIPVQVTIEEIEPMDAAVNFSETNSTDANLTDEAIAESILASTQPVKPQIAIVDGPVDEPVDRIDGPATKLATDSSIAVASIVDDVVDPAAEAVAETPDSTEQPNSSAANSTSAALPESIQAILERIAAFWQDDKTQAQVKPVLTKLNQLLATADTKLADRYGERYDAFKQEFNQDMQKTKVWYNDAKADAARVGSFWTDRKQAEYEVKAGEAGATIAQKEQKIKQLLKELWQTVTKG